MILFAWYEPSSLILSSGARDLWCGHGVESWRPLRPLQEIPSEMGIS